VCRPFVLTSHAPRKGGSLRGSSPCPRFSTSPTAPSAPPYLRVPPATSPTRRRGTGSASSLPHPRIGAGRRGEVRRGRSARLVSCVHQRGSGSSRGAFRLGACRRAGSGHERLWRVGPIHGCSHAHAPTASARVGQHGQGCALGAWMRESASACGVDRAVHRSHYTVTHVSWCRILRKGRGYLEAQKGQLAMC